MPLLGIEKPRSSLDIMHADDLRSVCFAVSTDNEGFTKPSTPLNAEDNVYYLKKYYYY